MCTNALVLRDGEQVPRCPECGGAVHHNGKSAVKLRADGVGTVAIIWLQESPSPVEEGEGEKQLQEAGTLANERPAGSHLPPERALRPRALRGSLGLRKAHQQQDARRQRPVSCF